VLASVYNIVNFSPCFKFDFLGTSQEIGWEEHLWYWYNVVSVKLDIKPQLNQSICCIWLWPDDSALCTSGFVYRSRVKTATFFEPQMACGMQISSPDSQHCDDR